MSDKKNKRAKDMLVIDEGSTILPAIDLALQNRDTIPPRPIDQSRERLTQDAIDELEYALGIVLTGVPNGTSVLRKKIITALGLLCELKATKSNLQTNWSKLIDG